MTTTMSFDAFHSVATLARVHGQNLTSAWLKAWEGERICTLLLDPEREVSLIHHLSSTNNADAGGELVSGSKGDNITCSGEPNTHARMMCWAAREVI